MNIGRIEIETISEESDINFIEERDWFKFDIVKENHGFHVQILKNGQYIFVSLILNSRGFPIEHIEFYMQESEEEVLEELIRILNLLNLKISRVSENKKRKSIKFTVEIRENDKWVKFGYPGTEEISEAST